MNVAEKPSVAKTVVEILSKNQSTKEDSYSKYNPIFNFSYSTGGNDLNMTFTSVRGHLMSWEFPTENKKWDIKAIKDLYEGINIMHKNSGFGKNSQTRL